MPDKNLRAVIWLAKTKKRILTRPAVPSGEEHGLLSRTSAGDRAQGRVIVFCLVNWARQIALSIQHFHGLACTGLVHFWPVKIPWLFPSPFEKFHDLRLAMIEWLGARLMKWLLFSSFFSSKVPEFLHVFFNLVVKHSAVIFSAVLPFVSEKNEDKSVHNEYNEAEQEKTIL